MNKEIEKIKETLSNFEYFVDDDFGGHYENIDFSQKALTPISILSIIEYIEDLQHQLEEKDKVIDEAIEFIDNYKAYENVYKQVKPHQFVSGFEDILDEENIDKLLEILERGKNGK